MDAMVSSVVPLRWLEPQAIRSRGLLAETASFWPIAVTCARLGFPQRLSLFCSRPFGPTEQVERRSRDGHVGDGFEARPEPSR